jgi:hypothetical protein
VEQSRINSVLQQKEEKDEKEEQTKKVKIRRKGGDQKQVEKEGEQK